MRRSGPGRKVARASPRLPIGVPDRVTGHDRAITPAITPAITVDASLDDVLDHVLDHLFASASASSPNASGDMQAAARRPGRRASGT